MTHDNDSIHKRKKGFKHSKKFARSQKGCLQCRQKKKKCDMTRPGCQSCSKRGIECEYPENIKIFQIESFQTYEPLKQDGSKDWTRTPKMKMHEIKFEKESESIENKKEEVTIEATEKAKQHQASQPTIHTIQQAPSSPLSEQHSHTPHIIEQPQEYHSPPHPHQEAQPHHIQQLLSILNTNSNNTDNAISLATEGRSIKTILDGFAIDLIKRSIESLQYVNLERQQKQYEQQQRYELEQQDKIREWAIKEALKFGGDAVQNESILPLSSGTTAGTDSTINTSGEPSIGLNHTTLTDWESEIFKIGWQG